MWNCTLPVPGALSGTVATLGAAKQVFRQSWKKFKAEIGPEALAQALETAQAARERG